MISLLSSVVKNKIKILDFLTFFKFFFSMVGPFFFWSDMLVLDSPGLPDGLKPCWVTWYALVLDSKLFPDELIPDPMLFPGEGELPDSKSYPREELSPWDGVLPDSEKNPREGYVADTKWLPDGLPDTNV